MIDDNKKKFDSILNEYKQKILDSIKLNNSSCEKIKELEEEKSFLREKSEKMSHSLKTCQSECNQLRQDVHLNIETKAKYESENETLKKKLSKLIDKIKNLHQSEDQRYGQTDYLTKKLAYFYEELKLNRQYYPSCHSSNPSLFSNY